MEHCNHCKTSTTPQWRYGPVGKPLLCNACHMRWKRHKNLNNYMPNHGFTESRVSQVASSREPKPPRVDANMPEKRKTRSQSLDKIKEDAAKAGLATSSSGTLEPGLWDPIPKRKRSKMRSNPDHIFPTTVDMFRALTTTKRKEVKKDAITTATVLQMLGLWDPIPKGKRSKKRSNPDYIFPMAVDMFQALTTAKRIEVKEDAITTATVLQMLGLWDPIPKGKRSKKRPKKRSNTDYIFPMTVDMFQALTTVKRKEVKEDAITTATVLQMLGLWDPIPKGKRSKKRPKKRSNPDYIYPMTVDMFQALTTAKRKEVKEDAITATTVLQMLESLRDKPENKHLQEEEDPLIEKNYPNVYSGGMGLGCVLLKPPRSDQE